METVHVGITVAELYANAMTRRLVPYKNYVNNDSAATLLHGATLSLSFCVHALHALCF